MRLSIAELVEYTGGTLVVPAAEEVRATGITWDSREVKPGDAYVALPGQRVDGHDFALAAGQAGAACILASHDLDEAVNAQLAKLGCAVVQVEDTAQAFVDLAHAWRGYLEGVVIGITGSSGKTTTKNLVRDVLAASMQVAATKANQNNELGVPRTVLDAPEDADAIVVEMGMRGEGQIAALCDFVRPDMGLITNVGTSHIELLGSREAIARAKGELYAALPHGGTAFVNADDPYALMLVEQDQLDDRGVRTVFYAGSNSFEHTDELGVFANADPFVWAEDITYDESGRPTFTLHAYQFEEMGLPEANGTCTCTLQLRGAHNVSNAAAAAAVGLALGMSLQACCDALAKAQPEQGRQQVLRTASGVTLVDDSYNANPDSMKASLQTFAAMRVEGSRIAVLGDMGELGSYAEEGHAQVGREAAASGLDRLVCVGELAQGIAASASEAGFAGTLDKVSDAQAALDLLKDELQSGDAVLVKASHSMHLENVVKGLMS